MAIITTERYLPTRVWLRQLARRHDLETQRPIIRAALTTAYQGQRATLESLFWLSCLLAAIIVAIVFAHRLLKQRTIYRTREQIAADLHDELGANLHAIALCSDLANTKIHDPEQLSPLFPKNPRPGTPKRDSGKVMRESSRIRGALRRSRG